MSGFVVKRWNRYGHDRMYVETADGTHVGYWDNKTSQPVVEDDTLGQAVEAAVAAFMGIPAAPVTIPAQTAPVDAPVLAAPTFLSAPAAAAPSTPAPAPAPAAIPIEQAAPAAQAEPAWADLTLNRPGQAAREQAVAHRQAAPVKTLFARVLGVHTDERAWRIGAGGEEAVAARLAKLGPECGSCTPCLSGPRQRHRPRRHRPRRDVHDQRQASPESERLGRREHVHGQRAAPPVRPEQPPRSRTRRPAPRRRVRLPRHRHRPDRRDGRARGFTVREQPPGGDVVVLTRREVDRWLRKRDTEVFSPEQVEAVHETARRSTTWGAE